VSSPVSSLLVGDRLVSSCDDGLLEAEYALFDRSEVLLSPGAREEGYMTQAGFAHARLREARVTSDLAEEAFAAMRGRHLRPLARSSAVRDVIDLLGPYEAFQGGRFTAGRGRFAGVWLDLDALAAECPLRDASILFQALHLVLVLEEVDQDTPVRLLTSQTGSEPTGGRTWRRVDLEPAQRLPRVLREMQAPTRSHATAHDEMEVREEILRDLRARAAVTSTAQPHLSALVAAISRNSWNAPATPQPSSRPPPGPIPMPPSAPQPQTIDAGPDAIDFNTALRQRNLRSVAQALADQAEQTPFQPHRAIAAARAWLAVGERASARRFARLVVDDASAADDLRIMALEILDTTPRTYESVGPMPAPAVDPPPAERQEVEVVPRTALAVRAVSSTPPPPTTPLWDGGVLDPRLVLLLEPDSERSASFRLLRDSLLARKAPRIIAVSSGAMHEGKTTCAINLALALSEKPSTRVLLLDGNFFAPSLGGIFHIDSMTPPDPQENLPWLSPYRIAQMMRGFYVAALVHQEGEPAPTFNGRWFDMVIDHLSGADYDYLVIDAAALDGSPAVAQVLGVAEGTLLTVRSHATTARALRRAAEQIPAGRALGITLMDGES